MSRARKIAVMAVVATTVAACGLLPPERVDFRPEDVLPEGYATVFEGFSTAMMGAGDEFENGHWLAAAPQGEHADAAVVAVADALEAEGFSVGPAGPVAKEWTVYAASDDARVFVTEFDVDRTPLDSFAPKEGLREAARRNPNAALVYIFATAPA